MDAEDREFETRIACLTCADDCAFFASSEAHFQSLYVTLAVVLKAEGGFMSMSKTGAFV